MYVQVCVVLFVHVLDLFSNSSYISCVSYVSYVSYASQVNKRSGLNLKQMEHLLARRIKNGNIDVLKKNMGKPELIRYDWSNTVAELILVLNLFSLTTPPAEGVQHIVKSIQCIQNGIQLAMPGKHAGADELIPTTIFLLASAGKLLVEKRSLLCIRLMYVLLGPSMNGNMDEYCVSNFEAALTQLTEQWKHVEGEEE